MVSGMDRRNFLRMMIGGVAASAATRTFPFRVYSFPKTLAAEIKPCDLAFQHEIYAPIYDPVTGSPSGSLLGMRYYDVMPDYIGPFMGIQRSGVIKVRKVPAEEAVRRFPNQNFMRQHDL